jgi:hypothetical protein
VVALTRRVATLEHQNQRLSSSLAALETSPDSVEVVEGDHGDVAEGVK